MAAARFFVRGFFVFTARTTRARARDFMTEFLQKSYISRRLLGHFANRGAAARALYPISYRILFTGACTGRNLREFNPPTLFRRFARERENEDEREEKEREREGNQKRRREPPDIN